ncbi:MAG: HAD-IB family hydrolase [Gammaproteobacteria bacterium]|nr:HAD-IB family hydrolase [Gammaproteobacteria bacterium]MCF6231018.1 HAD-IB family hydrolase [Gammaproteobacteria bacterium]
MSIAIFDLDNTLLGGDSDALWGAFIAEQGVVDAGFYAKENQRFYEEYQAGKLDINEFLNFSLKPLSELTLATLNALHKQFMEEKIAPIMLPAAKNLLQEHRDQGHFLMIITATNRFVTAPIAQLLGVDALIATDPEMINNHYSGKVSGIPCFQEGKVKRLNQWLEESNRTLGESWFYSDSQNDLPLLERVNHPIAVDPDPRLAEHATQRGWPLITLRDGNQSQPFSPDIS